MAVILGIDPGLKNTGWGVINFQNGILRYIACGSIKTDGDDDTAERLLDLHNGISEVIAAYKPVYAAMEETFLNKNALSSLKLGHARGAMMVTTSLAGLHLEEYASTRIKKSVTGVGRAEKEQMEMMVKLLLPGAEVKNHDEADALAVAICHAHHMKGDI